MKCIKAIRATKYSEVGDIKRVTDLEANEKVDTGYWAFVAKSEWKLATRKSKAEVVAVVNEETVDGVTISEKQLNKKKKSK
jgi:phosphoserine aminotransferase